MSYAHAGGLQARLYQRLIDDPALSALVGGAVYDAPLAPALGQWMEAMEAQMPEDAWMEYEYWKAGARDEPEKFRKEIPRFTRNVVQI